LTILEFLADFATLYRRRLSAELRKELTVVYGEDEQGGFADLSVEGVGGVVIQTGHPLAAELTEAYKPVLEDDQWELFLRNACPWRFNDAS
jgi:hypothetical protein